MARAETKAKGDCTGRKVCPEVSLLEPCSPFPLTTPHAGWSAGSHCSQTPGPGPVQPQQFNSHFMTDGLSGNLDSSTYTIHM